VKIERMSDSVGAIIHGVDVRHLEDSNEIADIYNLWLKYQVLVFRDQELSPADQLRFSRLMGEPDRYPFLKGMPEYPEITVVLKKKEERINFGGVWHTDTLYQERPPKASMLYAVTLPPVGGDTLFANQYDAYTLLPSEIKELIEGKKALSRSDPASVAETRKDRMKDQQSTPHQPSLWGLHPIVRRHPETGRPSLFVSPAHTTEIEGMPSEEAGELLSELFQYQTRESIIARQRWQKNDLVVWDNRCLLHLPLNDYHGYERRLHRITLKGDVPS